MTLAAVDARSSYEYFKIFQEHIAYIEEVLYVKVMGRLKKVSSTGTSTR